MQLLWYVAYGSNLLLDRFRCYLAGGRPAGGSRTYPGCRDPSDPRDIVAMDIPGSIYFAGRSRMWDGGMAFYEGRSNGQVAARAYLITVAQFSDVATQEMNRAPGLDLDVSGIGADGYLAVGLACTRQSSDSGPGRVCRCWRSRPAYTLTRGTHRRRILPAGDHGRLA